MNFTAKIINVGLLFYPIFVAILLKLKLVYAAWVVFGLAITYYFFKAYGEDKALALSICLVALAVIVLLLFVAPSNVIRIYPFLISISFLSQFVSSYRMKDPLIERYVSLFVKRPFSELETRYFKDMMPMWCIFLLCNSIILLTLTFSFSMEIWVLYSCILFYVILGLMILGSIVYAKVRY